jgi:hypothetical protein
MTKQKDIDLKKFHKADYNPRMLGANAKAALKTSIQTFDDISGIVVNKRTGNVLAGNHRWTELCNLHGESTLEVAHLAGEFHQILTSGEPTGFLMRIVDWELAKEKAANIAANSQMIAGEFTSDLQSLLLDVQDYLGDTFEDLRFDEISIDMSALNPDISDPEDRSEAIRKSAEEDNSMLDVNGDPEPGDVTIVKTSIKILVPGDKASMIREDLIAFLAERPYYDQIEIN